MAFQTLCKQRMLGEGETAPFMVDGHEVLVVWADGGKPRAFQGVCPHESQSLVNNSTFNGRNLICTVHGWIFDGHTGEGLRPTGCKLAEYPLRLNNGLYEVDLSEA